jgi:hypothetical protein
MTIYGDPKKRVWSGRHNKWVFCGYRYHCPICDDEHGGQLNYPVKGDRVCPSHPRFEFKHLPKKLWPSWAI